jgi:Ca2+/Na+ antiporter
MLLFATDMVNICLIFGSILLFAILPKKKEGSDVDGWLLLRDTIYYIIGVVALIALVYFDLVAWWSGILMLLYWLIHLIILSYNEYIRD